MGNSSDSGYKMMLWPEGKTMRVLQDIISKFTEPETLALNPGYIMVSTRKTCLFMLEH